MSCQSRLWPSPGQLFTHSWDLELQTSGPIHTPVGHACRASRCLDSSDTLWFCLWPWGTQFTVCYLEEGSISGHIGLVVWEAIIDKRLTHSAPLFTALRLIVNDGAESESDKHNTQQQPHCTHQYNHFSRHVRMVDQTLDGMLLHNIGLLFLIFHFYTWILSFDINMIRYMDFQNIDEPLTNQNQIILVKLPPLNPS